MTITIHEVDQRSDEWLELRRGIATASTIGKLVTTKARTAIDFDCPACEALAREACCSKRTGAPIATLHPERAAVAKADTSPPVPRSSPTTTPSATSQPSSPPNASSASTRTASSAVATSGAASTQSPTPATPTPSTTASPSTDCGFMTLEVTATRSASVRTDWSAMTAASRSRPPAEGAPAHRRQRRGTRLPHGTDPGGATRLRPRLVGLRELSRAG
jgi:hypothetical protein